MHGWVVWTSGTHEVCPFSVYFVVCPATGVGFAGHPMLLHCHGICLRSVHGSSASFSVRCCEWGRWFRRARTVGVQRQAGTSMQSAPFLFLLGTARQRRVDVPHPISPPRSSLIGPAGRWWPRPPSAAAAAAARADQSMPSPSHPPRPCSLKMHSRATHAGKKTTQSPTSHTHKKTAHGRSPPRGRPHCSPHNSRS